MKHARSHSAGALNYVMAHVGDRLHALDGARAVAACLVVAHHLGVGSAAVGLEQSGHEVLGRLLGGLTASGVELFFVLSSVVLAGPYVRGERRLDLGKYTMRRVERLVPPYFVAWLLAGLQVYLLTIFPTWWTVGSSLPSFSMTDWLAQVGIIYVGNASYSFAWWSLTIEVAFYVALPAIIPLVVRARRWHRGLLAAFLGSVLVACTVYGLGAADSVPILTKFAVYASCFCAGLVIAAGGPLSPSLRLTAVATGITWVLASAVFPLLNPHVGWGLLYFGIVSVAMDRGTSIARTLSQFKFVWLGERSYSLYLVHYSVIGLVCHAVSFLIGSKGVAYFLLTRPLSIVGTLAATVLLFHFIERRFARNLVTADAVLPWRRHADAFVRGLAPESAI